MIVVATPTRDTVTAGTVRDLIRLLRRNPEARWMAPLGIYIANLRNQACAAARGHSHLLFIDSDMRFPDDTIERLLAADKDVVAANCVQRTMPEWWVARKDGAVVSSVGKRGLEEVDSVGCGVMLIRKAVFDWVPQPWFSTPYDPQLGTHIGEDVQFCRTVRRIGGSIWIDHDLSQEVKHQGTVEWGVQNAPELVAS